MKHVSIVNLIKAGIPFEVKDYNYKYNDYGELESGFMYVSINEVDKKKNAVIMINETLLEGRIWKWDQ